MATPHVKGHDLGHGWIGMFFDRGKPHEKLIVAHQISKETIVLNHGSLQTLRNIFRSCETKH